MFKLILRIAAFLESLIAFLVVLSATGAKTDVGVYTDTLDKSGIFVNCADSSLPQTALHDIVLDHFKAPLPAGKTVKKCLVVGFDGARADALFNMVNGASGIQELAASGGVYQMYAGGKIPHLQSTVTAPGWTTLLTGVWANGKGGHGVTANGVTKAADAPPIVFTQLFDLEKVQKTAFIVSWGGHFTDAEASYRNDMAYAASKSYNALWLTQPDDRTNENGLGTYERTLQEVQDPAGADFTFCILEHCDHNGHGSGYGNWNPEYIAAFRAADSEAFQLIQAVKARATFGTEDWLILITSDHGGIGQGHGQQFAVERQIFIASNKELGVSVS
ncbi:MAG: alkaline phosphatase family protein [Oscillospiraceae bacterium]|jgi:predicted AlkP superfamily pyrophosphatase or phosphodiesterase|nr:alkaline phosphatase family protein [Oscillospiraceae bacterium]